MRQGSDRMCECQDLGYFGDAYDFRMLVKEFPDTNMRSNQARLTFHAPGYRQREPATDCVVLLIGIT